MKTNLQILAFEHKVTKAGKPFVRFQTEQGWMNCFDSVVNERIMQKIPANHVVEIEEKPNLANPAGPAFKNIAKLYDNVEVEKPFKVDLPDQTVEGYSLPVSKEEWTHWNCKIMTAKDIMVYNGKTKEEAVAEVKYLMKELS